MPVDAAMTAAIAIVASASPPGSRPNHILSAWNRRSAIPERSSMNPMNTNGGTAERRNWEAVWVMPAYICSPMTSP